MCLGCVSSGEMPGKMLHFSRSVEAANDNPGDKVAIFSKEGIYDEMGYRSVADYIQSMNRMYSGRKSQGYGAGYTSDNLGYESGGKGESYAA